MKDKASSIMIMIDEADNLPEIEGALEYLRNTFSRLGEEDALYSVTISGPTGLFQTVTEAFGPLERLFSPINLHPFTNTEVSEVLDKASKVSGLRFDNKVREVFFLESEGQPYVVQVLGYHVYDEATSKGETTATIETYGRARPAIEGMLNTQLFQRRFIEGVGRSDHKSTILRKMATASRDTFSFTEIAKLTGVTKKKGLGVYLTELVTAGCLRKDPQSGMYSFFMRLFKDYVKKMHG